LTSIKNSKCRYVILSLNVTKRIVLPNLDSIYSDIATLSDVEKLQLIDKLLISMHPVNKGVEAVWENEAEERLSAFSEGRVPVIDEKNILQKYCE
jgi:hypothetical protein